MDSYYISIKDVCSPILSDIVPLASLEQYFSGDYQKYWVKTFTHESYEEESEKEEEEKEEKEGEEEEEEEDISLREKEREEKKKNEDYELPRYFGSYILNAFFSIYCTKAYPGLREDEYTNVMHNYLNYENNNQVARELRLNTLVRKNKKVTSAIRDIDSDVYLAFFFTLFTVANKVNNGTGGAVIHNLVNKIYKDKDIEESYFLAPITTRFIELFNNAAIFGKPQKIANYISMDENYMFVVNPPQKITDYLRDTYEFDVNSFKPSDIEDDAFKNAYHSLDDAGIVVQLERNKRRDTKVPTLSWDDDTNKEWSRKLKEKISAFLDFELNGMFNRANMAVWANAFTDPSYPGKNYQNYEFLGDRILNVCFLMRCRELKPNFSREEYSNALHSYQQYKNQKEISDKNGFSNLLRYNQDSPTSHKYEGDIFESFFGALYEVGNNIKGGLGTVLCTKVTREIYKTIDSKMIKTPSTTIFIQLFQRLGLPNMKKDFMTQSEKGILISLPPEVVDFIEKEKEVKLKKDRHGRYIIGRYADSTQEKAFAQALKKIEDELGIDKDWSIVLKRKKDTEIISASLLRKANRAGARFHIENFYFERPSTNTPVYYLRGKVGKSCMLLATIERRPEPGKDMRKIIFEELLNKFIEINSK